jgi:tetratricopeptide (TPR) repeat protein
MRKSVLLIAMILCLSLSIAIAIILYVQQRDTRELVHGLQELTAHQERQLENLSERIRSLIEVTEAFPRQGATPDRPQLHAVESDPVTSLAEEMDVALAGSAERPQVFEAVALVPPAVSPPQSASDPQEQQDLSAGLQMYAAARYPEATLTFRAILDRDPDNFQAHQYLAASLYLANPGASAQYREIERHLQLVIHAQPDNPDALQLLALLYTEQQRWQEALKCIRQAIALQPENVECLRQGGLCALYANDRETAAGYFEQAIVLTADDPDLWYYLGLSRAKLSRLEAALEAYRKCLVLQPRHPVAGLRAGQVLRDLGRYDEGRRQLADSLAVNSGGEALEAMGDCCFGAGAFLEAESYWSKVLDKTGRGTAEEKRRTAELSVKLARSARSRDDPINCLAFAERGLACESMPILQAYQGLGYLASGQTAKGRMILQSVLQIHPDTEAASLAAEALVKL